MKKIYVDYLTKILAIALFICAFSFTAKATIYEINSGRDSLLWYTMAQDSSKAFNDGDTLMLNAGIFVEPMSLDFWKNLTLMGKPGLITKPKIVFQTGCFRFKKQNLAVRIENLTIEGKKADGTFVNSELVTINQSVNGDYIDTLKSISIKDCEIFTIARGLKFGNWSNVYVDSITLDNLLWHDKDSAAKVASVAFFFGDKGTVRYFSLTNSTFYNFGGGLMDNPANNRGGGSSTKNATSMKIIIDHNTFYNILSSTRSIIQTNNIKYTTGNIGGDTAISISITNNIFHTLWDKAYTMPFSLNDSSGPITIANNCFYDFTPKKFKYSYDTLKFFPNVTLAGNKFVNPGFKSVADNNFTISDSSSLLTAASDGGAIGDPEWVPKVGVTIAKMTKKVFPASDVQMTADVSLGEGADLTVNWSVENNYGGTTGSASIVASTGVLHGLTVGKIKVIATSNYNNSIKDTLIVEVFEKIMIASIEVSGTDVEGNPKTEITNKGGYIFVKATVLPGNADEPNFTWSLSDDALATISAEGNLVAKKSGALIVKAVAQDGSGVIGELTVVISGQSLVQTVTVAAPKKAITTNGGTLQLAAVINPADADITEVIWSVDDTTKAKISETGLVTAIKDGVVTVTATSKESRFKKGTFQVTISNQTFVLSTTNSSIDIFPNPATNFFTVKSSVRSEVSIYDLCGRIEKIVSVNANGNVDVQDFNPGIYMVNIKSNNQVKTIRLVIK